MRPAPIASSLVTLGALVVLSILAAVGLGRLYAIDRAVADAIVPKKPAMEQLSEVVTKSDGRKVTVTATRLPDESLEDFIARYEALVAAVQAGG